MGLMLLFLIPLVLGIWAQAKVTGTYNKWCKIRARCGLSGAQAASEVMRSAGINDVKIVQVAGFLTDHYNPRTKELALSEKNFHGTSLAALGVAAHEAGHAIQHKQGYGPLKFRAALVPITNIASQTLPFIVLGGLFFGIFGLIKLGILAYMILTIFQLVTLPVEFDASNRAKKRLLALNLLGKDEAVGVVKTLNAAGFTYVAAFVSSLANLMYFFMLSRRN